MNSQKVEMYMDKQTGKWILKHQDYKSTFDLESILQNHFGRDEDVKINFTGIKEGTSKINSKDKLTMNKEPIIESNFKGFIVAQGNNAINHIENRGKLWFADLNNYLSYEMHEGKLQITGTCIEDLHTHLPTTWTLEEIAKRQWLIKENPNYKPKVVMYRNLKFIEVTGHLALIHLKRGVNLYYEGIKEFILMKNIKGRQNIVAFKNGDIRLPEYTRETKESVVNKNWFVLEEDYETA
ncbi:hypothetical protein [Bacillus toyonensis]|uniref:hypothetical protein n=1 Tax=Bacillus toyonensis TaxID=155322 RepID=UPI000BFA37AB|nr:hypothetical protein [Bacillus toyonensis]PGF05200.1 hypothetical protein COM61_01910 [Bacillus toyonensis]